MTTLTGTDDWRAVLDGTRDWAMVLGDNRDLRDALNPKTVDAVISDPPYGMRWPARSSRFTGGTQNHRGGGKHPGRDSAPVIGDDGPFDPTPWIGFRHVALFGSNHFAAALPVGTTLVWIKRNDAAFGTFLSDAELAWVKGGHGVYCRRDMSLYGETRSRIHPTQKPVGVMEWAMDRAKVPVGAVVWDPYTGSGSTGVACLRSGRRFIGHEVDPTYHAAAVARLVQEAAASQPPLVLDGSL